MIEFWDYLLQFFAVAAGFCAALRAYLKSRRQPWFLLTCFYGTFALGTLYWTLHLLLRQETPQIFYVSDLAWLASYVFLLALTLTLRTRRSGSPGTGLCWLAPVFCLPQFVLYGHLRRSASQRPHVRLDDDAGVVRDAGPRLGEKDGKRAAAPVSRNGTGLHNAGVRPVDGLLLLGERHPDESLLLVRFPADPRSAPGFLPAVRKAVEA